MTHCCHRGARPSQMDTGSLRSRGDNDHHLNTGTAAGTLGHNIPRDRLLNTHRLLYSFRVMYLIEYCSTLRFSQCVPVQPGKQVQAPPMCSQAASFSHWHLWRQAWPKKPSGHPLQQENNIISIKIALERTLSGPKKNNVKDLSGTIQMKHHIQYCERRSSEAKHTFVTAWSCVTCLTMALPSHRVTASCTAPALTQVGTVLPPASRLTRCHKEKHTSLQQIINFYSA